MKSYNFQNAPAVDVNNLDKETLSALVEFVAFAGIAVILPFFHNQLFTGPIVNAIFYIAVVLLGVNRALFIALIPSVVAISVGLLPFVIYPIVPFIIIGNIIQILIFNIFKKKFWLGVVLSALAKFIFIFGAGNIIFNLILKSNLSPAITLIFSWPQLLTALAGGAIAYLFLKMIKKI